MPAKKKATKAKSRKKTVSKSKAAASKKAATKKKTVTKASAKKKAAKKKAAKKKAAVAKPAKKAAKKTTAKKGAKKKTASGKKAPAKAKKKPVKTAKKKATGKKAAGKRTRSRSEVLSGPLHGFSPYEPSRGEEYMSADQLEHFRQILTAWKRELMEEVDRTVHHMQDEAANFPDPSDRATQESEFGLELRTRDRERKLLRKIDSALNRIDEGTYGYCDETGEEIGLKRLEARPVATLSVEAQERRELAERQFRDRDDQYR
ncbi:MAG: RNA polymerase-binding protein DksA [Gammaproteobacteria bacterium]